MSEISALQLEKILERCPRRPEVYVETGAHGGERLQAVSEHFREVYGIELSPEWAAVAKARLWGVGRPGRTLLLGDSRVILPELLELLQEPVLFHLDAHYCHSSPPAARSSFPLFDELELLRGRRWADVVSVDDVHTFGKLRPDLGDPWEIVTRETILHALRGRVIHHEDVGDTFVVWLGGEV